MSAKKNFSYPAICGSLKATTDINTGRTDNEVQRST
jgi:hypothetical protein